MADLLASGEIDGQGSLVAYAQGRRGISTSPMPENRSAGGTLYDDSIPPSSWTLTNTDTQGYVVTRDTRSDLTTANAVCLLWWIDPITNIGRIHYQNSHGVWSYFDKSQETWIVEPGDPRLVDQRVTDITLSMNTLTAGLPVGTIVGNLAVEVSEGAFAGVFTDVTGDDGDSFSVLNNQLVTSDVLNPGINSITLSTVLNGITFSKNFTITVTPVIQFASVMMNVPTGKVLTIDAFGVSTGADARNGFSLPMSISDLSVLSDARTGMIRLSAAELIPYRYSSGTTTIMDNWYNTLAAQIMLPNYNMIMGAGGPQVGDMASTPAQHAAAAATFAQAMLDAGHEIFRWEIGDEEDLLGYDLYLTYYLAIADALLAVNPNYLIGGPVTVKYGVFSLQRFVADVLAGSIVVGQGTQRHPRRLGFLSFHSFDFPTGPFDNGVLYNLIAGLNDVSSARADLVGTDADFIPIFVAGNLAPLATGTAVNESNGGMVAVAYLISKYFNSDPLGNIWFGLAGEPEFDGESRITPQGYYMSAAAQRLPGNQVSVDSQMTNVDILATVNNKNFAIQLINYDLTGDKEANINIIGGLVTGNVARWEMGKGRATPIMLTQADLASIALPSETIVILTGTLQ